MKGQFVRNDGAPGVQKSTTRIGTSSQQDNSVTKRDTAGVLLDASQSQENAEDAYADVLAMPPPGVGAAQINSGNYATRLQSHAQNSTKKKKKKQSNTAIRAAIEDDEDASGFGFGEEDDDFSNIVVAFG